jgi:AraC family transcriptional regulator
MTQSIARSQIDADATFARGLLQYHVSEREIAGFHSTETVHPPGFRIPDHFHDVPSIYIVLQGSVTEFYGRKSRECKPVSLVFTPPGETHSNVFSGCGGRCFRVEMPAPFIERVAGDVLLRDSAHSEGGILSWLATRLYREFQRPDAVSLLCVEGLMLEVLSELSRLMHEPASDAPAWLRQAREFLHDQFSRDVTLDEIARLVGVHPAHLARAFRRYYRCTLGEYQRRLRVEFASRQLSETRGSIAEIAIVSGFADQAHFSRAFRTHTGLTPAKFRRAFRRSS